MPAIEPASNRLEHPHPPVGLMLLVCVPPDANAGRRRSDGPHLLRCSRYGVAAVKVVFPVVLL